MKVQNKALLRTMTRSDSLAERFCEVLINNGGNIGNACEACGLTRLFVARWSSEDADFAKFVKESCHIGVQVIEDKAINLALNGTDRPVVSRGQVLAWHKTYDSKLIIKLLESKRPNIYKPSVDLNISHGEATPATLNTLNLAAKHVTDLEEIHGPAQKKLAAPGQEAAVDFGLPSLDSVKPAGGPESS